MDFWNIQPTQPKFSQCKKVIFDVDTGGDDFHSILLFAHLAKKLQIEIIGITCIFGNTSLNNVFINSYIAKTIAKLECNIYKGSQFNLKGQKFQDQYFGKDGISDHQTQFLQKLHLDSSKFYIPQQHASIFIINMVKKYPGQIGLIFSGPLTNLAIALNLNPQISELIKQVCLMGGNFLGIGNTIDFNTEFNMKNDYIAAGHKLKNLVIIPLELTTRASHFLGSRFNNIFNASSEFGQYIKDVYQNPYKLLKKYILCDPLVLFPLMKTQSVIETLKVYVRIRPEGQFQIDWYQRQPQKINCEIVINMDWNGIESQLLQLVQK